MHRRAFAVVCIAAALVLVSAATLAGPATAENGPSTPGTQSSIPADSKPPSPLPDEAATSDPAPAAPTDMTQQAQSTDPVIAAIRATLAAPALAKKAHADDLAALQAFYAERSERLWITGMGFSFAGQAVLDEIVAADIWGLSAASFDLPDATDLPATADEQAAAEIALDLALLKYARFARGGRVTPSEVKDVFDQKPPLRDPKTVLAEIAAAEKPGEYLRALHPKHEQFQKLREALVKARAEAEPNDRDIRRILVNMERWRWMPEDLGPVYVWNNVPEFMLRVVKNGAPIHVEKTIVGAPRYATLIFSADMENIVFNPQWTVPQTIIKEDLLPKLKKRSRWSRSYDTSVLKTNKLKVRYDDKPVDPEKIDWARVNMGRITFVQAPGPTNVLGKVKFIYPNEHAVYMHDTRKRHLFKKTVRAEGHHCIRVAEPDKLAAVLLAEDKGWTADKIKELYDKGHDEDVKLDRPIPVHTAYFTAWVDAEGKVETYADIYKLDEVVGLAVLGSPAKASAIAGNAPVKAKAPMQASATVKANPPAKASTDSATVKASTPAKASTAAATVKASASSGTVKASAPVKAPPAGPETQQAAETAAPARKSATADSSNPLIFGN